jgi:hypothetical protein
MPHSRETLRRAHERARRAAARVPGLVTTEQVAAMEDRFRQKAAVALNCHHAVRAEIWNEAADMLRTLFH